MGNAGIFYGHLEYFTAIWLIIWPFGTVVVNWYTYFPSLWYIMSRKIWQPCAQPSITFHLNKLIYVYVRGAAC
jgi:hypothetical protein